MPVVLVGRTVVPSVVPCDQKKASRTWFRVELPQSLGPRTLFFYDCDNDISQRLPLARTRARLASRYTATCQPLSYLLNAMGAGPFGQHNYVAVGRLDGIRQCTIGAIKVLHYIVELG